MTGFMLDTDISSYIIKRRPSSLLEKFEKHGETLNVSVITAAELRFGAEKAARPKLAEFTRGFPGDDRSHQQSQAFLERARPQSGSMELICHRDAI